MVSCSIDSSILRPSFRDILDWQGPEGLHNFDLKQASITLLKCAFSLANLSQNILDGPGVIEQFCSSLNIMFDIYFNG